MRLINADAIPYNYTNERGVPMTREIDIQNMPTIEERKKGKWECISDGYFEFVKCDKCGHTQDYQSNYCPKCGADMRGEEQ